MIPFPLQLAGAGLVDASAQSYSVSYVAASGAAYVNTATSINSPSSPAGIQNGDALYAIVFARSALTPPAGWTLVASQSNATGVPLQTIYIYRKDTVTSGDASTAFTWSQASAGRMGLAYVVARSTSGTINQAQTSGAENDVTTPANSFNVTIPVLTAAGAGELFLIAASSNVANPSPSMSTWTAPSGSTIRTTASLAENRLMVATQARGSGQSNATPATFAIVGTAAANYFNALTVRLTP